MLSDEQLHEGIDRATGIVEEPYQGVETRYARLKGRASRDFEGGGYLVVVGDDQDGFIETRIPDHALESGGWRRPGTAPGPEHRCLATLEVRATDSAYHGRREFTLPFVPSAGLFVQFDGLDDELSAEQVAWDAKGGRFRLDCGEDGENLPVEEMPPIYAPAWPWEGPDGPYTPSAAAPADDDGPPPPRRRPAGD